MKKQLLTIAAAAGLLFTGFNGNASAHENIYKVKAGDTLWKISQANNLSVQELMNWNNLSSPIINIGQNLSLLAPHSHGNKPTTNGTVSYTVKSGDTLWGISARHKISISQLKTLNKLTSDVIYPGQTLIVSVGSQTTSPTQGTGTSSSTADSLVLEAKKHMGVPYVWGGSTTSGFDCSGYLNYVFNKIGVSIPRTVAAIWDATKNVSSPKTGDIVFFETYTTGPSHAGIYLGNNQFIHAGSSTGVTISDLNFSYWKTRYLGAKTAF